MSDLNIVNTDMPVNEAVENDFSQVAESLKELARDMTTIVKLYAPPDSEADAGVAISDVTDWKHSIYSRIFDQYLHFNPHAEDSIEELMTQVGRDDCPELFELCRIEKALTYILACLSVLAGPSVDERDFSSYSRFPNAITRRET